MNHFWNFEFSWYGPFAPTHRAESWSGGAIKSPYFK
jgi:hypothetical protein